jgi:hypothetical protein
VGPSDERFAIAQGRAAALEPRLPRLIVKLSDDAPAGTTVLRDDVELGSGSLGVALPVDPGKHVVTVRAPERVDQRYEISVAEGERQELSAQAGVAAPPRRQRTATTMSEQDPAADASPAATGSGQRTAGFVILGLGAVGLATGAVTGGLALSKKAEMEDNCDARLLCNADGVDAADSGATFATVSTGAFIAGAAAAALGTVLILTSDSGGRAIEVGGAVTPAGSNLLVQGRF